jgi:hypothetical protein
MVRRVCRADGEKDPVTAAVFLRLSFLEFLKQVAVCEIE